MEIDQNKMSKHLNKLAEPIDFGKLEKLGLLSKEGAWYRVPNVHSLPEHVSLKIKEVVQDSKGTKAKFDDASKFAKLAKKLGK